MDKIMVGLPAYNEGKVISKVIASLKEKGYSNVVVLDDCSSDDTARVSEVSGAKVLKHRVNKGAGAATRSLISYARKEKFDYLILMDSDGQHKVSDISRLMKYASSYDVVIGSRMLGRSVERMPLQRKLANFFGSLVTWFFFHKFVRDSQSGFKVLNKKAINSIKITFERYEFCSEMIGEMHKNKLLVKEVPISVVYNSHSLEKGHGQSIFNGFIMCWRFGIYFLKRLFKSNKKNI